MLSFKNFALALATASVLVFFCALMPSLANDTRIFAGIASGSLLISAFLSYALDEYANENESLKTEYLIDLPPWKGPAPKEPFLLSPKNRIRWETKRANEGCPRARVLLAKTYMEIAAGTSDRSYAKARSQLTLAAFAGDVEADVQLGEMYYYGKGFRSYTEAYKHFYRASRGRAPADQWLNTLMDGCKRLLSDEDVVRIEREVDFKEAESALSKKDRESAKNTKHSSQH